jgi:hypothetical protein
VKTKAAIAGAVVLAVVLSAILLLVHRGQRQAIAIRHVKSAQSGDVTTMTFEITNHTSSPYMFLPFGVYVRNGNVWTMTGFPLILGNINPANLELAPRGVVSYTVNVTNLPANSGVRFSISTHRMLLGVQGFVSRICWNVKARRKLFPLNPFDKNNRIYEPRTEDVSVEWVEMVKQP